MSILVLLLFSSLLPILTSFPVILSSLRRSASNQQRSSRPQQALIYSEVTTISYSLIFRDYEDQCSLVNIVLSYLLRRSKYVSSFIAVIFLPLSFVRVSESLLRLSARLRRYSGGVMEVVSFFILIFFSNGPEVSGSNYIQSLNFFHFHRKKRIGAWPSRARATCRNKGCAIPAGGRTFLFTR